MGKQKMKKLTEQFLIDSGWLVEETYPLMTILKWNSLITASIGRYGHFSIRERHWMNEDEFTRVFETINSNLTEDDYNNIIRLLCIKMKKTIEIIEP